MKNDVFILLDRTGSMYTCWEEALSSVNTYINSLEPVTKKYCSECGNALETTPQVPYVTVVAFDRHQGFNFDVLRENSPANFCTPITSDEVQPRGATPLLDAVGRIIDMAERKGSERTIIVVMTDGEENSSQDMTKEQVRRKMDKAKGRGWQVLFLGADFDAFDNSRLVGVKYAQTISVPAWKLDRTMDIIGGYSQCYFSSGADINFSVEDRVSTEDFTSTSDNTPS